VIHKSDVNEDSKMVPFGVKAAAIRTLEWACARARKIRT